MLLAGLSTLGSTRQTLAYRQDLSVAYNNLGYACMVNKHWDEAVSPLKTSLAVLSSNAEAYYNLGECYMHLNRPGEAKDQILEGMRSRPGAMPPQHSRSTLARAYAGLGEFDQAAEEFRKALYSDPSDIEALFGLAVVYRQMGRSRQALALLEEYFSVHPADQQGLILAIDLAMSVKDSSKALGMLPRLSSVAADDPAVYDFMGKVLASAGRYQEAKNEFERALALAPDSISVKADLERLKQILSTAGLR
jgi:tetratricopeptide (TPR) repeat protein